ncbi:MAG: FCD domain-containing protein [Marmoricola sp.]
MRESVRPLLLDATGTADDWPAIKASLHAEHREILSLIRHGEPDEAARAVEDHIRGFHGTLTDNR